VTSTELAAGFERREKGDRENPVRFSANIFSGLTTTEPGETPALT